MDEMNNTRGESGNRCETDGFKERHEPPICRVIVGTKAVEVESEWLNAEDQQATEDDENTNPAWRCGKIATSELRDEHENAAADLDGIKDDGYSVHARSV